MGGTDLLVTKHRTEIPGKSFPNGAHICEVEIDPETGQLDVVKYTVVDDLGVLMNPALAAGQVHGGVAQGVGQVVTEQAVYDESGQLLSGSFMDYAMPRAADLPFVEFHSEPDSVCQQPDWNERMRRSRHHWRHGRSGERSSGCSLGVGRTRRQHAVDFRDRLARTCNCRQ